MDQYDIGALKGITGTTPLQFFVKPAVKNDPPEFLRFFLPAFGFVKIKIDFGVHAANCWLTEKTLLSAGLKYQDTAIITISSTDGNSSLHGSPDSRCENTAPDIQKKKPA